MDELLSEKEQIEALRSWWRENGRFIISGLVLGIALLLGFNYWNKQKAETAVQASAAYEALLNDVASGNAEAAGEKASELTENYGSTVYAAQARLAMAKLYMDKGRDQDAASELKALVEGGDATDAEEAVMTGRLRLAKILLYQDKPQEAIDLLQGYRDTAFAGRYSETLGDAYVALGQTDAARDAYTVALADDPNAPTVNRILVQMKLNDLPKVSAAAADDLPSQTPSQPSSEDAPAEASSPDDADAGALQ
ncbi:MAG TPA: tetratricopeptide repeat protein [Woeseiaceae bacterium]|nr:tetratricopeptide repeat protein [Woeseiaceae bacterium]